jgi:hypothetical protein
MTGIGNDSAYRIWFLAHTTKFTPSTHCADACTQVIAAAQQLFGAGSKVEIAVNRLHVAGAADAANAYVIRSFDVTAYKAQTVPVVFTETETESESENYGAATSFDLDAVGLKTD